MEVDIAQFIRKGGIHTGIEGSTPEEVLKNACAVLPFPQSVSPDAFCNALCAREEVMSTAIGNGIMLPHASSPMLKEEEEQRIYVVYPKTPLDVKAMDGRKIYVMFILLTQNRNSHLNVLASLQKLFSSQNFRTLLEHGAEESVLLEAVRKETAEPSA